MIVILGGKYKRKSRRTEEEDKKREVNVGSKERKTG